MRDAADLDHVARVLRGAQHGLHADVDLRVVDRLDRLAVEVARDPVLALQRDQAVARVLDRELGGRGRHARLGRELEGVAARDLDQLEGLHRGGFAARSLLGLVPATPLAAVAAVGGGPAVVARGHFVSLSSVVTFFVGCFRVAHRNSKFPSSSRAKPGSTNLLRTPSEWALTPRDARSCGGEEKEKKLFCFLSPRKKTELNNKTK